MVSTAEDTGEYAPNAAGCVAALQTSAWQGSIDNLPSVGAVFARSNDYL